MISQPTIAGIAFRRLAALFLLALAVSVCAAEEPVRKIRAGSHSGMLGGLYVEFSLPRGAEPRAPQDIRLILPRDYPRTTSLATTSYDTLGYCQHSQPLLEQFLASPYWGKSSFSDMTPVAIQCKSRGFLFLMPHSPQAKANLREGARHTGPEPLLYLFIDHELTALTDWSSIADPLSTLNGSAARARTELAKRTLGWDLSYETVIAGEKPADVAWLRNWVQSEGVNTASKIVGAWKGDPIVSSVLIEVPAFHAGELLQYWLVRTKQAATFYYYANKQQREVTNLKPEIYDAVFKEISSWKQSPPFPAEEKDTIRGYLGFANLSDRGSVRQTLLSIGDFFVVDGGHLKRGDAVPGTNEQMNPLPGRLSRILENLQYRTSVVENETNAAARSARKATPLVSERTLPNTAATAEIRPLVAYALSSGDVQRAETLINSGADVNAVWHGGTPVLLLALENENTARLGTLLIEKGTRYDVETEHGVTPLMLAAGNGSPELVKMLLKRGVDVHARNVNSSTALHYAAVAGRLDNVKILLAARTDPNVTNRNGETPLRQAQAQRFEEIVTVLKAAGAR